MNRVIATASGIVVLSACASNPMMTGKPQHWKGKTVEQLRAGLGEPSRILPAENGAEIWEYRNSGEFLAPGRETMQFSGKALFGAIDGGATTVKQGEHVTGYENLQRFEIRGGKVRKWYVERSEGGRVVWSDR